MTFSPWHGHAWFSRFWTLSLMEGIDQAGVAPINLEGFNTLAYLANAIAPCYQIEILDPTVLKEKSGPLYPKLIWDLDRLVGLMLVLVSNVRDPQPEGSSPTYSVSRRGLAVLRACEAITPEFSKITSALRSIALAYARNSAALGTSSLLDRDGNYGNNLFGNGDVVDFGQWTDLNATQRAVQSLSNFFPPGLQEHPSRNVNIYARYLAGAHVTEIPNV